MKLKKWLLGVMALALVSALAAQPNAPAGLKQEQVPLHPWQAALPRLIAEAYFTNLNDGDKIETPFLVKFGLSGGWGIAPISKPVAGNSQASVVWAPVCKA